MDKQEWVELSIEERLNWYNNELDSLFQYLVDKEPFEDHEFLESSTQTLTNIKEVMEFELTTELEEDYKICVQRAYRNLPNKFTDRSEWFDKLGRANELLISRKKQTS
ncbi:hypothetical protein ACG2F4_05070 [Halalkalibaculum sp. DA3122]|uniref:hypothetical protein n=1 Tax=Halalkalibaculum sp. DA3122 TaxID=3373607 RepID=UPI00375423F8